MEGTGGGPPSKIVFSNFEEEVLELLTPEAADLLNIPEGGVNIEAPLLNIPEGDVNIEASCSQNIFEDDENIEESVLNECERDTEEMTQTIEPQDELLHRENNNVENVSSNILKRQKKRNINKYAINKAAQNINRKTKGNKDKLYKGHVKLLFNIL